MYIKQSKSLLALLEAALVRIISFRPFCTASTICCTLSKHSKYIVEYCYLSTWIEKQPPFSNFMFQFLKLRSSACTKTAAPTWFAAAIWTLLLFWPTVARSGRLNDVIDERSLKLESFWKKAQIFLFKAACFNQTTLKKTAKITQPHLLSVILPFLKAFVSRL